LRIGVIEFGSTLDEVITVELGGLASYKTLLVVVEFRRALGKLVVNVKFSCLERRCFVKQVTPNEVSFDSDVSND